MKIRANKRPPGQIRQSQVVTTFGPGSMVDLPNYSVLVAGLDEWSPGGEEIHEDRLVEKLKSLLEVQTLRLLEPPPDREDPTAPPTGITAWQFPEWFITQDAGDGKGQTRSRMLVNRRALSKGKFIDADKKKHSVVPVRFVRACPAGHIDDIDWRTFVHRVSSECQRQLWMDERGTSGDLSEIWVRCECGAQRELVEAAGFRSSALGYCGGKRPWLGAYAKENCNEPSRLLIRTASNAYFPQLLSVISLPARDEAVKEAVTAAWDFLEGVENADDVARERKKAKVRALLEGITDDEVLAEIQARLGGAEEKPKSVKRAELETLIASKVEIGSDRPDGVYFARTLPRADWDQPWMAKIERVVLVHRLREVTALLGFTRFEAQSPDTEGELEVGVRPAALAREGPSWLPAFENKGEGIFLQFSQEAIRQWLLKPGVGQRGRNLLAGFETWHAEHSQSKRRFTGLPYIMLHSFAHMLITAVSMECGYPASSIRERIYAVDGVGYGVLLYTGSPDAEGTLGGLADAGRRIDEHVLAALRQGGLCSNDPVCAQHEAENPHEHRFLHGAACHGCLLIAETSCEQHNEFLDRALVVPTVEGLGAEFFGIEST